MMFENVPALYSSLAAVFAALTLGSVARLIALRNAETALRRKRLASLRTWWILAAAVGAAVLAGRPGVCVLLAVASCIAWSEITRMLELRVEDRFAVRIGYGLILLNYALILFGLVSFFAVFLPVCSMLVLAIVVLLADQPAGYIRSAGALLWGMMFLGYGVSHAAYLVTLPGTDAGPMGPVGWLLFLIILTETDDIFQAIIGRRFGAHKRHCITPRISPNKTWEGFCGGLIVITVLAPLIAPWLTTLGQSSGPFSLPQWLQPWAGPILAALLIGAAGFFGDINMSAIKRDAGVKDSSKLLPGMGGMIDRVDSLSMTAPVFVYFVVWWMV